MSEYIADIEGTETEEDKDPRSKRSFWSKWFQSAQKATKRHWDDTRRAWKDYENASDEYGTSDSSQIYYSSVKTLEPAYYARTPQINTTKDFEIDDPVAGTGCLIVERLGHHLISNCNFDQVMQAAVGDFIHGDKASVQVVYTADIKDGWERAILFQSEEDPSQFLTESGEPYLDEVMQDSEGYYGQLPKPQAQNQRIYPAPLPYDEVLHTPEAKIEAEITEKAYFFCMTEEAATARFGEEKISNISWKTERTKDGEDDTSKKVPNKGPGKYLEGWEIWSKPNKMIYWYSEQYPDDFLDSKPDDFELEGFFPSTSFAISSKPSKSLYPTPAHKHLLPTINLLIEEERKVEQLIAAIDPRALVDVSQGDILTSLASPGLQYIGVKNIQSITDKGGLQNLMYFLPVEPFTNALSTISQLEEKFKNDFFERFGIPDILRGATDPLETAAAQTIKAASSQDRFKFAKKQIANMARETIQIMVDLALKFFDDATMARVCGLQYMSPEDQQRFPMALAMLRSDEERIIRIDIDTDTMSFVDDMLRAERVGAAMQGVTSGLEQVSRMIQISPDAARVGLQTLLLSLDAMSCGKRFQDGVKQALEKLIEQAENPAPSEPPPDYEMLKIQVQQQKLQLESQKVQGEQAATQRTLDLKQYQMQLDSQQAAFDNQIKQIETQLSQRIEQFQEFIQTQQQQLEEAKIQLDMRERYMTEQRLQQEAIMEQYKINLEAYQAPRLPQAVAEPQQPQIITVQAPPITLINEASKPGKRTVTVTRDGAGNMTAMESHEMPDESASIPISPTEGII